MPTPPTPDAVADPEELSPEDFYFDGPYLVFTEAYHLRRGYCCNSSCRHCPYGNAPEAETHAGQQPQLTAVPSSE